MLVGAVARQPRRPRRRSLLYTDDVEVGALAGRAAARPAAGAGCRGHRRAPGRRRSLALAARRTGHPARRTTWRRTRSPRRASSRARSCTATGPSWPTPWSAPTRTTPSQVALAATRFADLVPRPREDEPATRCAPRRAGCSGSSGPTWTTRSRSSAGRRRAAAGARLAGPDPRRRVGRDHPRDARGATSSCGASWCAEPRGTCCPGACSLLAFAAWQHGDGALAWCAHRPLPRGRSRLLDGPLRRAGPDRGGAAERVGADPRGRAARVRRRSESGEHRSSLVTRRGPV